MLTLWGTALALLVIQLVYHQVTTIFDFYPFNNIKKYSREDRFNECLITGVIMAFPLIAMLIDNRKLLAVALIPCALGIVNMLRIWWVPYFLGPSPDWEETYNKTFSETIIILPRIKNHPIPNLEHLILHSMIITSFVLAVIYITYHY